MNRRFIIACNGMHLLLRYTISLNSMINATKNAYKIVSEMLRNRIERTSKIIQKRFKNPAVKYLQRKKKKTQENALAIEKLIFS